MIAKLDTYLSDTVYEDVANICRPFLKETGITFFDFARMYDDGTCIILSNRKDVISHLFTIEAPIFTPIPKEILRKKTYYLIPDSGPYQTVMHDVRSNYNLAHCIDLFECHLNYVDVACFGSTTNNSQIVNYYLNNIDRLEKFQSYFKASASELIQNLTTSKLELPSRMRLNFTSKSYLDNKEISDYSYLHSNERSLSLTNREIEIAQLLIRCKTAKEISLVINRSSRTVEHHIENIKVKAKSRTKSALIERLMDYFEYKS